MDLLEFVGAVASEDLLEDGLDLEDFALLLDVLDGLLLLRGHAFQLVLHNLHPLTLLMLSLLILVILLNRVFNPLNKLIGPDDILKILQKPGFIPVP